MASKAIDPPYSECTNLKADAILAGIWMGAMGINLLPPMVLLMIICINLMGAGGMCIFIAGAVLMVVSCLVTLQLMDIPATSSNTQLSVLLSLPVLMVYPLLSTWVSYQTLTRLAGYGRCLQVMSTQDGMIGVYNRHHWELLLRDELDNCCRHQHDVTLLIIDINHSKNINGTQDHDVGDQTITALTRQLQMILYGNDVIGRSDDDEFAVIMYGTLASNAIAATPHVHEWLTQLCLSCASQVNLHISVGVAPLTPEAEHYREWLKSADMALYKAKNSGRNRTEATV